MKTLFRIFLAITLIVAPLLLGRNWLLARAQEWVKEARVAEIKRAATLSQGFHEDARALAHELAARRRLTAAQEDFLRKSADPANTLTHLRHWAGDEALRDALPRLSDQLEEHRQSEDRITWLGDLYLTIKKMRRD